MAQPDHRDRRGAADRRDDRRPAAPRLGLDRREPARRRGAFGTAQHGVGLHRAGGMMRTVGGRTDHVVVVGAGLAGLSAALHLAGRGPLGDRRRTRRRARRPGRPTRRRRLPDRHRPDGAHDARPDRRDLRGRRRIHRRPARAGSRSSPPTARCSPTAARSTCTATATRWRPRSSGFAGPQQAAGLPAAARLARRGLYEVEFDGFIGAELRLAAVAADPAAGPAGRARRLPALGPGGEAVHHRSSGCTGSSPSRRSTRGCRRSGRSRCTPSSPTWTPSPACTSRAAECGHCPTRWPPPRSTPGSNSATAQR